MTHVPNYPHADPRQNWVYISSPIAASDSPLPLYMPTPTSHVHTPTTVNNTPIQINTVNTHTAPLNPNVPNVNSPTQPSQPPNPAQLANLLYPRLLHQQSLFTSVQNLLDPLHSSPTLPTPTLHTLHKLLYDKPHLRALLPPLPQPQTRPTRAPPPSYADPTDPQPPPAPNHPSYPFGDAEGVAIAPSRLNTPDSQAGMGLFGIRSKHPRYTKRTHLRHLFARQGD